MADQIVEPTPGTPEYDEAMARLVDDRTAAAAGANGSDLPVEPPAKAERPADVPEKFWDAEKGEVRYNDLLKSYRELEGKIGQPPAKAPEAPPKADQPPVDTKVAEEAAKAAGVDLDALTAEYFQNGNLTDASLKALEAKGIGKDQVDAYIAGQQALAAKAEEAGKALVGGSEKYSEMTAWAAGALSVEEKVAYNNAVNHRDPAFRELAILGLQAKFQRANGTDPQRQLNGGSSASTGEKGFGSRAEMSAAINDPRFNTDSAYRARVERRISMM